MNAAAGTWQRSGNPLPLPARFLGLDAGGASGGERALRERLLDDAVGALRARQTAELDAWLTGVDTADGLRQWFGDRISINRRWLLLALDRDIADIDALLSEQVNAILHAQPFQRFEARWRGLKMLTNVAELSPQAKVRLLSVSWNEVIRDVDRAADFDRSQLFNKIYTEEVGMLGGEPFGLLIGDYDIQHRPSADHPTDDIAAVKNLAMIASAAFAPLVMGVSARMFQLENYSELGRPFDLRAVFRQADYQRWQALRDAEETRFVGLAMPRILMRLPYAIDVNRRDNFVFSETVDSADGADYLWGNAAFGFGSVVLRAFANFGWFADIRGSSRDELGGGLLLDLPIPCFATDSSGVAIKPSVEALLSETQEKELSELGFIALRKIPFSQYSVFYSNQSIHAPERFDQPAANINARLSAMLQYMLCISRFAHYIKLLGRSFIGTQKTAQEVQESLGKWLLGYCLGSDEASQESKSRFPLRQGTVTVREVPGKAGTFSCVLFLRPHFQLDDITTGFRLVTQLAPASGAV